MILSKIFPPASKNRKDIDQSTRYIMLVLLREIINNRIEIEALKETIKTKIEDSAGDTHDHKEHYESGLSAAKGKWASDLADINKKIKTEEVPNDEWTNEYKKALEETPLYTINGREQMKTDANKIKKYDTVDQAQYIDPVIQNKLLEQLAKQQNSIKQTQYKQQTGKSTINSNNTNNSVKG